MPLEPALRKRSLCEHYYIASIMPRFIPGFKKPGFSARLNKQELYKILNSIFVAMYKTVLKDARTLNNIKSLDLILIDYLKNFPFDTQIKIDTVKRLRALTIEKSSYIIEQNKKKKVVQPKKETIIPKAPVTEKPQLTWSERAKELWNSWFGNSAPSPITTPQRDPLKKHK